LPAVSGLNKDGALYIHQNAEIYLGKFDKGSNVEYKISNPLNGAYIFLIDGQIKTADEELFNGDAIGVWETDQINLEVVQDSYFIIIDVPMN